MKGGSSRFRVEKYRPITLQDVVSHQQIITTSTPPFSLIIYTNDWSFTVEKFIEKNRLPHLLFYGPPGTGKTSTILAVARRIYGADYRKQILEVIAFYIFIKFITFTTLTSVECFG